MSETQEYQPEEISAFILEKIRKLAKTKLQGDVNSAAISVPVYFGNSQKQATKDAAYLAGFEVVYLIDEPTAVALAFQYENKIDAKQERNILIYNFGRVTLDVSIVNARGDFCDLSATDYDCHLGGRDIDQEIFKYVCEELQKKCKKLIRNVKIDQKLIQICEDSKKYLSTNPRYYFTADVLGVRERFEIILTRRNFEKITNHIFNKAMEVLKNCLRMAKLEKDDIDVIVMIGGSTRIPKVKAMIEEYFGKEKVRYLVNADHQFTRGAIMYASTFMSNKFEKAS